MVDYIHYKHFSEDKERTFTDYKSFFETRFPDLFKWFYPSMREDGFVPFASRYKNQDRCFNEGTHDWSPHFLFLLWPLSPEAPVTNDLPQRPKDELGVHSMSSTELYFFSVGVFFRALIPQVIHKVAGADAWSSFLEAGAWPKMSAGLGGFVSAEQWIYESGDDLFPSKGEAPYYNALLDIVLSYHTGELTEFLNGNRPCADTESFSKLHNLVKEMIEPITDELSAATEAAKEHFLNGEHPIYYLPKD